MQNSAPGPRIPLHAYALGFLRQARLRRILTLAGYRVTTGWPGRGGAVAVWGQRPVSARGRWVAQRSGARLLTIEDGFLRSLAPGVSGAPPLSLVIDDCGIYYDAYRASRLECLIANGPPDPAQAARAEAGISALLAARLSKYTPAVTPTDFDPGYVLVVDQTRGDASIAGAGASADAFATMLQAARADHPTAEILIKAHPDTAASQKTGHYDASDVDGRTRLIRDAINPWDLIGPARAVYTVSSQLGYEALLAGRPVRTFGAAFYAGWGLTEDDPALAPLLRRRTARPDLASLFWACHLAYPTYYDPWRDRLCAFETTLDVLRHQLAATIPDHGREGEVFSGVRLWKRRNVMRFRPDLPRRPRFAETPARARSIAETDGRAAWHWASKAPPPASADAPSGGYVEDGFLRSVGLGAALTEAASLVFDRQGIYFDPNGASDLEDLIADAAAGAADLPRAARLREDIVSAGVTKYNVGAPPPEPPQRRPVLLVPGQVEDDASILRGCGDIRTNLALLHAARAENPDAWLIYKPHPDVEAGLRKGLVENGDAERLADAVARNQSSAAVMQQADAVWTMTSLMGFEALLRGLKVTCLGAPFYAGWGLTDDRGPPLPRRRARPSLDALVWAALIAYPAYRDPVSGLPCPPELIVERFATGAATMRAGMLSRLQGLFAAQSWLWRR